MGARSGHTMTKEEIRLMVAAFGRSAAHLREAGYDGVEVHASHRGLQEQFISPYFNRRSDEYGGRFENRMRFLMETLETVREAAGPGMAVGIRFTVDQQELQPNGYTAEGGREVLAYLARRPDLLDFVDLCTHGGEPAPMDVR